MNLIVIAFIGCLLGRLAAGWAAVMLSDMNSGGLISCQVCGGQVAPFQRWLNPFPIPCGCRSKTVVAWPISSSIGLGAVFAVFAWLLTEMQCQTVHEVRPESALVAGRLPFHLALIFLMWVATLTDLLDYVIPDEVVYSGIAIAIIGAFASGEFQMIHIWVDWDKAIEGVQGPFLPEWMKNHQHLHGLAWSIAGLACGASLTWLIRFLSERILGQPALGFGDVTLMAMIGAFLGWQPTLCILAIAPLTGVVIGLMIRLTTGRSFVAYGPYLACSALIVMCSWRWLWADYLKLRDIFSHWPTIAGLVGFSLAALCIMLIGLRMFRSMPAKNLRR